MKNLLLVILALIALGLGYLKWSSLDTASPLPIASSDPVAPWSVLSTDYFELSYPKEATATAAQAGIDTKEWRITYMGDIQKNSGRTQTELWDGYAISVTRFEGAEADPQIQAEVDRQGTISACGEERVTPISQSQLGQNIAALKYHGGCLGDADLYYLVYDNILYRVTNLVAHPAGQTMDYDAITAKILSTISFK